MCRQERKTRERERERTDATLCFFATRPAARRKTRRARERAGEFRESLP